MTVLACEQNYQVRGVVCDIEGFRERLLAWIARELRDEEVPQVNINDGVLSFSGGFLLGLQWGRSLNLIDKGRAEVTSIGEEVSVKCSVVIKRIQWYVLLVCGVLLVGGVLGVCLGRAEAASLWIPVALYTFFALAFYWYPRLRWTCLVRRCIGIAMDTRFPAGPPKIEEGL